MNPETDRAQMRAALALGRRGLGQTWPNPSVGCVIVANGRVVARGVTAPGGRPHAEAAALAVAGPLARGATAYVTLEPCSHHGRTPPCADALIAAGIARVVVAGGDPDPRVNGAGLARLRRAGVAVTEGVLGAEADDLQAGFLTRVRLGRPMVTLKLATSLDGRIATASGESRWITGPAARRVVHALRGAHDATLTGVGTVLADDPALTCRIAGLRRTPDVRIVLDRGLRTPSTAQLVQTAREAPTWIVHGPDACGDRGVFGAAGVRLVEAGPDVAAQLGALGAAGLTRVLVEAGAQLAGALLQAGCVDRLAWFHAPGVLGDQGLAAAALTVPALRDMTGFTRRATREVGPDMLTLLDRAA